MNRVVCGNLDMSRLSNQTTLPSLGKRSPVLRFYLDDLRRAFYLSNLGIFLLIFLVFAFIKYQRWRYEEQFQKFGRGVEKKVVTIYYAQLGPPPSILGEEEEHMVSTSVKSVLGAPKPVPDSQALAETSPEQTIISGAATEYKDALVVPGTQTSPEIEVMPYYRVEVKPVPISIPKPEYPDLAIKTGIEGQAVVTAMVDIDGSIEIAQILKSSGNQMLDEAALVAARQARFTPAKQQDNFVRVWVSIPYRFKLTGGAEE